MEVSVQVDDPFTIDVVLPPDEVRLVEMASVGLQGPPGAASTVPGPPGPQGDPGPAGPAGGGSSITVADVAPSGAAPGDAWWDSSSNPGGGNLYIRYSDPNSTAWVPASNQPGPQGPTGAPGTNANISGLTTGQIGIAGSATSLTSSIPTTTFVARAGDTMTGALTINSTLAVGGNANPTLEAIGGFTRLHATDTTGVNGGIFLGDTANGKIALHRRTTHNFQDDAATVTFAIFDAASTRNVSGAWATISSASLKEQIEPYKRGLEAILELNPVQFRYQAGTPFAEVDKPSRQLFGLIAEEVAPHVPEIVGKTTTEIKGVDTEINTLESGNLIYALINAVKELSAKVAALEAAK